jgi:hypothetical protein
MPDARGKRSPALGRWLIAFAGRIVPGSVRPAWCTRWHSHLQSWWILVERGEFPGAGPLDSITVLAGAFADAFWHRFSREGLGRLVRGPGFALGAIAAAASLAGLASGGFPATRALWGAFRAVRFDLPSDPRQDLVVGHGFVIAFAIVVGISLAVIARPALAQAGWRYTSFFCARTAASTLLVTLLWIESNAALQARLVSNGARALGGFTASLLFLFAFGYAVVWCSAEQRIRCPVCLRRLELPVRIGSWGSIFEPVTTELLCEDGHGALTLPGASDCGTGQWIRLDSSWQALFQPGDTPVSHGPASNSTSGFRV